MKKNIIAIIVVIVLLCIGAYFLLKGPTTPTEVKPDQNGIVTTTNTGGGDQTNGTKNETETIIGKSAGGHNIVAYHYGSGSKEIVFVGGIHGGYEWNTALVAYNLKDYLDKASSTIPANVRVTVIPVLNPDGLIKVAGTAGVFTTADVSESEEVQIAGRFNANGVDLNRNFACDWQSKGTWQDKTVNGGTEAFSEPESQAIKQYIEKNTPNAVVVWYSAAGGVYSSSCHNGVSSETSAITGVYANASGYPAYKDFDFYAITGDMTNWLAKQNIPAISVLLTNHTDTEWTKNQAGIKALLQYYSK
jgi:hypothetical protein